MIYSNRQFHISTKELAKLKKALLKVQNRETNEQWLKQAEIDAIKSQITEIEAELSEYKLLLSGQISLTKTYALEELPNVLVQARIASGMSQTNLAQKLNLKPQQVQRYEATNYMGASLRRLIEVSRVLGVKTSGTFEGKEHPGGSVFMWSDAEHVAWRQFPYKEMIKRNWFEVAKDSNPVDEVKRYFYRAAGPQFATAYHRKKMRIGSVPNEYALLAWQARVLERARDAFAKSEVSDFDLDDRWLPELVSLTSRKDGVRQAGQLLAKKGIALVIEKHLQGSYLDGAAMLGESELPIIGLTLRYDRLDNFWFVLLHELGHVFLHLFDGQRFDFFDEEGVNDTDSIETEADQFALNTLVPEKKWAQCLSRFALTDEAVQMDARNLGIHPSIIAGRIRRERGDYAIMSNLVGQGEVRTHFEDENVGSV